MTGFTYKNLATKPRERLLMRQVTTASRQEELKYEPIKVGLNHRFRLAYDQWLADTYASSRFDQILGHQKFLEIVNMGTPALPLIFERLALQPSFIYLAAERILGGTPEDLTRAEDFDSLITSWLEWSEIAGYRNSGDG